MGKVFNFICLPALPSSYSLLPTPPSQSATRTHQADLKLDQPEHRDSGRLGGQYIHNSLNASRQIKLKTFTDSPPGNFWRKEACRSEPSWPIFSLITSNAAPRPFSWSPKVCFTATIPYINPNYRYSVHYFSSSPFKTCFHSKTKTALHQWMQNSISLMKFLLITSCSHCRINI